ncbi:MAG: SRPBCC family protein [Bacteroidia bacterium]|nr:SRPBCC family protein [Bacteroidia bacterium]MDW8346960.1 SRPBCC family protein [Bacteroidia bacterium]
MKKVQVRECANLPINADILYDIILDITKYYQWWPSKIELNILRLTPNFINSELEVRPPTLGTNFCFRIIEAIPHQKIVFEYFEGIQQGKGTWTFIPVDNIQTTVCYEVDVIAKGLMVNFVSVEELIRIQQKFIQDLFSGIKRYKNLG